MRRTPSPALVISIIALVVALGGTSYAAVKINGKNIKKSTIAGNKLKKNTLTGTQIRESRLAKVPKATRADSAATADNAVALAGTPAAGFIKGSGSVYADDATLATGNTGNLLVVPGMFDIVTTCLGGTSTAFTVYARTTNLSYALTRILPGSSGTTTMLAGTLNAQGSSFSASSTVAQTITGNVWQPASGKNAAVSAASLSCKASAVVTVVD